MKIILTYFLVFTSVIILYSCGNGRSENDVPAKQDTPDALQDDKLEIKSYSRGGDLTEELYQELVGKSSELKKLEDDFEAYNSISTIPQDKFDKFDDKSTGYYNSAGNKSRTISDTLLRKKIEALISTSKNKYSNKTAELNSLLKQISKNEASLNDQHSVLKIVLTLPLIEKYQNENIPATKEFKDLLKEQEKLIEQTRGLTPKY